MPVPPAKLTPDQKLRISSRLYATARKVKLASLRLRAPCRAETDHIRELNRRFFLLHD